MIYAAICPACSAVRARTADVPRGTPIVAADFVPEGGQELPVDGQPALCTACGTALTFRWLPSPGKNGVPEPVAVAASLHNSPRQVTSDPAVRTLFQVVDGEEVKSMRELGRDRVLILTNRRAVVLDIAALVEAP